MKNCLKDVLKVMFKFALNATSTIQSFFTSREIAPITVFPNQVLDVSQIHGETSSVLTPIDSFLNYLDQKKIKRFCICRSYAMGDILLLVPVIRALRKQGYDAYIRTTKAWKSVLDLLDIEMQITEHNTHPEGWGVNLDGILEQDHFRAELSEMHRCDIYAKALGMGKIKKSDWSMDLKKLPEVNIEGDYIAFQYQGSTKMKQLSTDTGNWIIKAFEEKGISVVQISESKRMSAEKLFAVIAKAKLLITMDSSPNWIAHFTKTPTILLLGPTRASERITKHPLYPDKAVGIALNKEINCSSCFEQAQRCAGRIDCLKLRPEKIFELIKPYVLKFWEN